MSKIFSYDCTLKERFYPRKMLIFFIVLFIFCVCVCLCPVRNYLKDYKKVLYESFYLLLFVRAKDNLMLWLYPTSKIFIESSLKYSKISLYRILFAVIPIQNSIFQYLFGVHVVLQDELLAKLPLSLNWICLFIETKIERKC